MYEDAVMLALSFDGDLAASIARQPEGDEGLSRKLWLAIAKHLIQQGAAEDGTPKVGYHCAVVHWLCVMSRTLMLVGSEAEPAATQPCGVQPVDGWCWPPAVVKRPSTLPCIPLHAPLPPAHAPQPERIRAVTALLESARGAVRIEDILPLFPDFVEIDAFKDAICRWAGCCLVVPWVFFVWHLPANLHMALCLWRARAGSSRIWLVLVAVHLFAAQLFAAHLCAS